MVKKALRASIRPLIILLLALAAVLFVAVQFKTTKFNDAKIDEILFYLNNGLAGGQTGSLSDAVWSYLPWAVLLFIILWLPTTAWMRRLLSRALQPLARFVPRPLKKLGGFTIRKQFLYAVALCTISCVMILQSFSIPAYVAALAQSTKLYEEHYVDPRSVELTFPEKKRNLIYVYLESVENTVLSREHGGMNERSVMPELETLARENLNFSHTDAGLGGALPAHGTTWTVGGMTAQSAGVPLKQTLAGGRDHNSMSEFNHFLPGAHTLGDILKANGYNQSFVMGSDAAFGGRDKLLMQHGDYQLLDFNWARREGKIPADYKVWWGYEDKRMFEFAKEEATRLSQLDKPFNLQLLTVDTHYVDGWMDETCPQDYAHKYDNVHACSSRQVKAFIDWLKQQPFYDNTTVIITGDHLGMQTDYYTEKIAGQDYQRTIFNAFLNPALQPHQSHSRQFTSFDMYPTTLAAMGVQIKGERLGLGTNLFSSEKTLTERLGGIDQLNQELPKRSSFYERRLMTGKK